MSTGNISLPQGAAKLSEIFTDEQLALLGGSTGDTAMKIVQLFHALMSDVLRRQNYILFSSNEVSWATPTLSFNDGVNASDIILRVLQTESNTLRTVDLVMTGSMSAPTVNTFQGLTLADGEMLYLELDRSYVLAASSGQLVIDNGIDFPITSTPGKRLLKVSLAAGTGMPQLISPEVGTATTYYIPLAMRYGDDIWWIPHGIRWINPTISMLGAIVTKGLGTLPDQIVTTVADFVAALSLYSATGGIICIDGDFSVAQNITIPTNVWVIGKSRGRSILRMGVGYSITMNTRSKLENLGLFGSALATSGNVVTMSGSNSKIVECKVTLQNTSGTVNGVSVSGSNNKIVECEFVGCEDLTYGAYRTGINYAAGADNVDVDTIWS